VGGKGPTQGCHSFEPKLIQPKIGTETRKPDLPTCLYSAFVSLMERSTGSLFSSDIVATNVDRNRDKMRLMGESEIRLKESFEKHTKDCL